MTTTIAKILGRKDASSVVVATVLGFLTFQFIVQITGPLSNRIGVPSDSAQPIVGADFYVPAASYVLQLFALEILLTLVVVVRHYALKSSKPSKKKK